MSLLKKAAFALEESTERNNQLIFLFAADPVVLCHEREIANEVQLGDEGRPVDIARRRKEPLTYTDRFLSSLIALISIFRLPILAVVVTYINRQ